MPACIRLLLKYSCFFTVLCLLQQFGGSASLAEELYLITTRSGETFVVKDYRFTDEYVEFTTENGLPGFIRKEEFARIGNMVGVPAGGQADAGITVSDEERRQNLLLLGGGMLVLLAMILLLYFSSRREKSSGRDADIYYRRREMEPVTPGHLSFEYRGRLGGLARWTIEVRQAYEEDGVLYIEGVCTTSGKRKQFRADRVAGPVTDMSTDRHGPMEDFFTWEKAGEKEEAF